MESERQTINAIQVGAQVLINVGLGAPVYGTQYKSPGKVLALMTVALRDVLQPGFRGEVHEATSASDEPTLVVAGVFNESAYSTTLLYDAVANSGQDCIALWYPELGEGHLMGPRADKWGAFNPEFFKLPTWLDAKGVTQ